jgi:cytochrome c oxidase subunit 2
MVVHSPMGTGKLQRMLLCRAEHGFKSWNAGSGKPAIFSHGNCRKLPLVLLPFLVISCSGAHSPLDPAGREAADVATLFFSMLVGAAVIWAGVVALFVYAARKKRVHSEESAGRLILWGGAVLPCLILAALLSYAVWLMPNVRPWFSGSGEGLRTIDVTGEQFWWRVRYFEPDGSVAFETANEVRMPVGERVAVHLTSPDVIHSFWIPVLGGKMDMIPGRRNILTLEAQKPGTYRGVCAEFCGTSHALMAFTVEVMEPADYDRWLASRQVPAVSKDAEGLDLFLKNGCGACHTISGTEARGTIGPDLTAFGERGSVGAGTLSNTQADIERFIREPSKVKPGNLMPHFSMLPEAETRRIAQYLKGLQ